jgi:hypothetical protein
VCIASFNKMSAGLPLQNRLKTILDPGSVGLAAFYGTAKKFLGFWFLDLGSVLEPNSVQERKAAALPSPRR